MTTIETNRARLRKFKQADLAGLTPLLTDPDIMKFTGFRVPQSPQQIQEHLDKQIASDPWPLGVWAAEEKATGELIGWFMLKPRDADPAPELGFMVNRKFWGKGFATEIAQGIIAYGFTTLHLSRIVAITNLDNYASIKVLKKIGMSFDKTFEKLSPDEQTRETFNLFAISK